MSVAFSVFFSFFSFLFFPSSALNFIFIFNLPASPPSLTRASSLMLSSSPPRACPAGYTMPPLPPLCWKRRGKKKERIGWRGWNDEEKKKPLYAE
ncbi:uncharacterized protein LY79DRAFT_532807 [Colletotrichum navitas]|uniref:Uncharacterized protein n=1 Tax=Colletotrichum navitas TaxID=681940 RepID=A0AAD8QCS4_9PEZI|nr:uncharacterized protein LY79DRAFT_532807 [Colletotrichum navitas]KAK1600181.1 hypothetical protein LY79DRAFT_532807 [Colletotrichum navitas]